MVILGIEASGNSASAAVVDGASADTQCLGAMRLEARFGHAGVLTVEIDAMLKTAGVDYAALQYLAVGCGPGSFTGIRVGLAAAVGYGLALGVPVYGVSSLEAMAGAEAGLSLSLMDTRRGGYFAQMFEDGKAVSRVFDAPLAELAAELPVEFSGQKLVRIRGAGARELGALLGVSDCPEDDHNGESDGAMVARVIVDALNKGADMADFPPSPRYHAAPLLGGRGA